MFRKKKTRKELPREEETHEKIISPCVESFLEEETPRIEEEREHPRLEEDKLRNTLYYLASLIPRERTWKCHFVDSSHHTGDITTEEEGQINIQVTLTKETEQFTLLPFGDKPVWCSFPPYIEFSFSSSYGEGKVEALHLCEKGVHKLIFPEEVKIDGKEYSLHRVLPLKLKH